MSESLACEVCGRKLSDVHTFEPGGVRPDWCYRIDWMKLCHDHYYQVLASFGSLIRKLKKKHEKMVASTPQDWVAKMAGIPHGVDEVRLRRPPHRCPGPNCNRKVEQWVNDGVFIPAHYVYTMPRLP